MPFALNEETRLDQPGQGARVHGGRPAIVSTSIPTSRVPNGEMFHLGDGADGFPRACERRSTSPSVERAARRRRAQELLDQTIGDETVTGWTPSSAT